ncbi:hypothetical protein RIF23_00575 [Lipingzhangella sp. LS1_29]|uniref:Secreted protein n=1 Tax=Lipingzhangella rawalii TaxID=2055835 RepID=A0ABU2H0F6_9ACTN|nr:hypothetical protein [Lipingzhangella rawalii]MDS1268783.1 hypothetical protein [Lipingzhangella rawalii]
MRKFLAVGALAFASTFALAPAAHAGDGDTYAVINGDVASKWCALPWNWEGPGTIASLTGPYSACIDGDVKQ